MADNSLILTISCPDRRGIVAAVARFLNEHDCNILDSQQFGDRRSQRFFLRVHFLSEGKHSLEEIERGFGPLAAEFAMDARFFRAAHPTRTLVMVSRFGHALVDLLYRHRIGAIPIEIPLIVSNHLDFEDVARANGIPFVHLPVTVGNKVEQEKALADLIAANDIELIVLARYMQVLSGEFSAAHAGRIINIHHSFLPSFQGASPYTQAHDRGVKLIGATAHYVTAVLDEGPIIEQAVTRVTHAMSPEDYIAAGRDIESAVLARAVKWHCEHRIMLNGSSTVIFP